MKKASNSYKVTLGLCLVLGVGAITGIGFGFKSITNDLLNTETQAMVATEEQKLEDYSQALDEYYELAIEVDNMEKEIEKVNNTTTGNIKPEDVLESVNPCVNNLDNTTLADSLEAAGLSKDNITNKEGNVWVYQIQRGDTLSKISAAFGVSVDELAELNHIKDVNLIYTGSALRIPIYLNATP